MDLRNGSEEFVPHETLLTAFSTHVSYIHGLAVPMIPYDLQDQ